MTTQRMDGMTTEREKLLSYLSHQDDCPYRHDGPCECEARHDASRILAAGFRLVTPPSGSEAVEAARSILARPQHHIMPEERIAATYILSLASGKDVVEGAREVLYQMDRYAGHGDDPQFYPRDIEILVAFATACVAREREEYDAIFRWLFGEEGEFPERQPGQGAYYWRSQLRKRLEAIRARRTP